MRRSRLRFTVRHLLILIALVAVLLGGVVEMRRRRHHFAELAREHRHMSAWFGLCSTGNCVDRYWTPETIRKAEAKYQWHEAMYRKYWYAAFHPWLPVAPDSPAPEWTEWAPPFNPGLLY